MKERTERKNMRRKRNTRREERRNKQWDWGSEIEKLEGFGQ